MTAAWGQGRERSGVRDVRSGLRVVVGSCGLSSS